MITWIKCHHVKKTEVRYWRPDIMGLNYFYPRELEIIYKSFEETALLQAGTDLINEHMYTLLCFHFSVCGGMRNCSPLVIRLSCWHLASPFAVREYFPGR